MDAQQAELLGNCAFFNTLGDLMILRTFVEPDFDRNDASRLVASVTAALTRDFIIPPLPENLLPANVVPLPNDHDEIKHLLSRFETCAHEFSHAVNTLKKSFVSRPRLLQTPSGPPNGVQKPKHHMARGAKLSVRRTLFLEQIAAHKELEVITNGEIPSTPSPTQQVKRWLDETLN